MYGNDLCVADIPGVLVFAVNHRRERVPLNAQIMIPHTRLQVRPTPTLTRTRTPTRTPTQARARARLEECDPLGRRSYQYVDAPLPERYSAVLC